MSVPVLIGYTDFMMNVSLFISLLLLPYYHGKLNDPRDPTPQNEHWLNTRYEYCSILTGKRRFNIKLWKTFTDCFNCLPIAAIVDEKIFCCHGGLSPDLQSMEQIRRIMRPTDVPDTGKICLALYI